MRYLMVILLMVTGILACQPQVEEGPDTYPNAELLVEAGWLAENLDRDDLVVVDMREERDGDFIPGAVNIHWERMIAEGDIPYFKSAEEIAEIHAENGITPDKRVITHCHSNTQASNAYFVLRLMGYQDITSYEGSWSEYGNVEGVPVVN